MLGLKLQQTSQANTEMFYFYFFKFQKLYHFFCLHALKTQKGSISELNNVNNNNFFHKRTILIQFHNIKRYK